MHPEHASHEPNPARVGLMRGILVIVTALAVGAFVLSRVGFDDGSSTVAGPGGADPAGLDGESAPAADTTDTTDGSAGDGSAGATTGSTVDDGSIDGEVDGSDGGVEGGAGASQTTVTTALQTTESSVPAGPDIAGPAQIAVLVLNAEGTKGIAGQGSEVLRAAGYQVLAPKNATKLSTESRVLYTGEFEAEAVSVASALGAGAEIVSPFDPADPPLDDIGDAMVVVIIGQDQAFGL